MQHSRIVGVCEKTIKNWRMLLGLFLLSIVFTATISPVLNWTVKELLPSKEVIIRTGKGPVYLLDNGYCELFEADQRERLERNGWVFYATEDGYAWDMLVLADSQFAECSLSMKEYTNANLTFWANAGSDKVSIIVDGTERELDLYNEQAGGGLVTCFPFQDSKISFFLTAGAFFLGWLGVCLFSYGLFRLLCLLSRTACFKRPVNWRIVVFIWGVFFVIAAYQYANDQIPNFLALGDQLEYWNPLWEAGADLTKASEAIRYWNGYLCFYIPYFCRVIGSVLNINHVYIWLLVNTAFVAILCGYTVPQLYSLFSKKQAKVYQVLVFSGIYVFFWLGTLSGILMDAMGASCFLLGVLSWLKLWYGDGGPLAKKMMYAILAGITLSAAISFRTVYIYATLALVVGTLVVSAVRYVRGREAYIKKPLAGLVCFFIVFFAVASPQLVVNRSLGVTSFFPVASRQLWSYGTYDRSLSEYSMDRTLSSLFTGHPYATKIDMANAMKERYYNTSEMLTISQELDLFIKQPLDAISYIATKAIVAFDTKTNVCYPDSTYRDDFMDNLFLSMFSFANYVVLGSALFVIGSRHIDRRTGIFAAFIAAFLILPHMWTHVEWRYYLIGYILFYFIFSYYFCSEQVRTYVIKKKGTYFLFLSIFVIAYFAVSLNIWYDLYSY